MSLTLFDKSGPGSHLSAGLTVAASVCLDIKDYLKEQSFLCIVVGLIQLNVVVTSWGLANFIEFASDLQGFA